MKFLVRIEGREKQVEIEERNGLYLVSVDGRRHRVDCCNFGHRNHLSLLIDNKSYLIESAPLAAEEGRYYARVMGRHYEVEVLDELLLAVRRAEGSKEKAGTHVISSPMPGLIVEVKVKEGDRVCAGETVLVMEAMKMQNELIAEVDGVVREVMVKEKQTVESQSRLVVIERD